MRDFDENPLKGGLLSAPLERDLTIQLPIPR